MLITFLGKKLYIYILRFISDCNGDYIQSYKAYSFLGDDVVLPCKLAMNNTYQRWLKESSILTTGQKINNGHKRHTIDVNYKDNKYNLLISNVRDSDYGNYKCLVQNKQGVFILKSKITLIQQGMHGIKDQNPINIIFYIFYM